MTYKHLLAVAVGGAAGSVLRYIIQRLLYEVMPGPLPWGTFTVNLLGCFLIGVLYSLLSVDDASTFQLKLLLMTGFCGGFTTFSAFSIEGMALLQQQRHMTFFVYFAASIFLGLAATFAGAWLAKS